MPHRKSRCDTPSCDNYVSKLHNLTTLGLFIALLRKISIILKKYHPHTRKRGL